MTYDRWAEAEIPISRRAAVLARQLLGLEPYAPLSLAQFYRACEMEAEELVSDRLQRRRPETEPLLGEFWD